MKKKECSILIKLKQLKKDFETNNSNLDYLYSRLSEFNSIYNRFNMLKKIDEETRVLINYIIVIKKENSLF